MKNICPVCDKRINEPGTVEFGLGWEFHNDCHFDWRNVLKHQFGKDNFSMILQALIDVRVDYQARDESKGNQI